MENKFLYEIYDILSERISKEIPDFIKENLNPKFELREYQIEAFARFFDYLEKYKHREFPTHLLFNMATGSGKTLIMAGIILYLYQKGYRNFLFFVNSNNIIEKTRDNFLNAVSNKYLFNWKISINTDLVKINQVDNFESANPNNINICFTTIQKLHSDLYNEKENSITLEDFKNKKIVLISDESHHTQTKTRQLSLSRGLEKPSWENTVEGIFKQNRENMLLEFTATMDFLDKNIVEKYKPKVIYKYDLKSFRKDYYSKDINILKSDFDTKERIIQAIILNQYRQEIASTYGINLKPVILFKAQQTIAQSKENKELFHKIIDELSEEDIKNIENKSNVRIIKKAFTFFKKNEISYQLLVNKLKLSFAENKCLSVNEENLDKVSISKKDKREVLYQQNVLNSLEDKDNQIRAIFAVQKLNEGWDVLNLFDIVRLYTGQNTGGKNKGKAGKTTIAEAQLIGRGARYFPFTTAECTQRYLRRFDKDVENDIRILEELYYHSLDEPQYISELKVELRREGLIDET
jgi:type III restriction enzyme